MARVPFLFVCGILMFAACAAAPAAEPPSSAAASAVADVFDAEAANLVALRYIPNNARSAQVIVVNRTNRPLTLRMPASSATFMSYWPHKEPRRHSLYSVRKRCRA